MPTYIYKCQDCGKVTEKAGSYSEMLNYRAVCLYCRSRNMRKVINKPEIIYKGSGFYSTDKNKNNK